MKAAFVKVELPPDEGPVRRKKKQPVEEEVPVTIEPVVEVQTAPPVVQEEILEAPEEIVEVESAPPPPKDKVSEEFQEKEKKPKKGKVTDVFTERQKKKKPEGEKVKIKAADLSKMKAAFVKVELPPDEGPVRRKKKQP